MVVLAARVTLALARTARVELAVITEQAPEAVAALAVTPRISAKAG